jgi:hypothetical protein
MQAMNISQEWASALKAEKSLDLKGVSPERGEIHRQGNRIDLLKFYDSLKACMESRLLAREDTGIRQWAKVLDCKTWPYDPPLTVGETKLMNLCERSGLPGRGIWMMLVNTTSCQSGSYCELCNMR